VELTIPGNTLATADFMVFLKEISSDGNVKTIASVVWIIEKLNYADLSSM
jgi:hypothetical protein